MDVGYSEQRSDRIQALGEQLALPRAALEGNPRAALLIRNTEVPVTMFAVTKEPST